jgi:PAS domain S-box-containing protein
MFSRLSLRYRIALVIFVLEACMLGAVLSVSLSQSSSTAIEFNTASQQASLDLLSNLSVTALLTNEYSDYQLYIDDVQKQPSIVRIVLADPQLRVVADTRVEGVGLSMTAAVNRQETGWRIRPVNSAAGILGTLAVQFSNAALVTAHQKTRNLAIAIALAGMLLIALVGLATGFALTRRLQRVAETARRFAEGDTGARSRVTGHDEVAMLARDIDNMADAVSEQQRVLREQSANIELLLNSTAEAIYGVDTQGVCTFVNQACLHMLGYEYESDIVGKPIHALIHHHYPDGRVYPKEACHVRLTTLEGQITHADNEVHWRKDGSSFPVEYWSHPIYRDSQLIGAVVTFFDITERKQADAQIRQLNAELESRVKARTTDLEAANKELEAFSYSVSHDLRAPLRAIDGFSQALLEDYSSQLDETGRSYLQRIRVGAQHMGHLIDDLLKLSRVSRASLVPERVDLSKMARFIVKHLGEIEPERDIRIDIEDHLRCVGDPGLLRIALQNLLDNAWKYTGKTANAHVSFNAEQQDGETVFRVRDNGVGFDMAHAGKLFGAFQRLHHKRDFEGTGIGLATVARIIHRHGGRVWAESEAGKGATFCFTLGEQSRQ